MSPTRGAPDERQSQADRVLGRMDQRILRRLIGQLAGDGWLLCGPLRLGSVTYAINIHEVRTSLGNRAIAGTDVQIRLLNHTIDAATCDGRLLTLQLHDGREIRGFMSPDCARLVLTSALA